MAADCSVSLRQATVAAKCKVFRLGDCVRVASYRAEESLRCHQSLHETLWLFGLEVRSAGAGLGS